MKRMSLILFLSLLISILPASKGNAQGCSLCTKNAQQLGEKPAKGLNTGIMYLAATPLVLIGFISYRWWKANKQTF